MIASVSSQQSLTNVFAARQYDIAVIGGGPAGSSAALRAARLGARVLLIEKSAMPRPKLCGGWVSGKALDSLGFDLGPAIVECPFTSVEFRFADSEMRFTPNHSLGAFVDRAAFDHYLARQAQEAGAEILTERVTSVAEDESAVEIVCGGRRVTAGAAIICTGANTSLIRTVRELDDTSQYGICIEQRLPAEYGSRFALKAGAARLQFGIVPFGYAWLLHHGEYLIVGVGCRRSRCDNIRDVFDRFWNALGLPDNLKQPKGHVIPFGGYKRALGKGRILTAGDAAGLVDPFNGEGISYAIRSGQFAAEAIAAVKGKSPLATYEKSCQNHLLPDLRMALRTARIYYNAPNVFIRAFCSDRAVLAKYNAVLEGRLDYRRYLRWALRKRMGAMLGIR